MAASKPTSWLFVHLYFLFHLAYILGPYLAVWALSLLTTNLITRSLTASLLYRHSEFDWAQYPEVGPSHIQCSTFDKPILLTLSLKIFRGEPAISEFDWNFSPSHKSSEPFSTGGGSVLHKVLPLLQPAHG